MDTEITPKEAQAIMYIIDLDTIEDNVSEILDKEELQELVRKLILIARDG